MSIFDFIFAKKQHKFPTDFDEAEEFALDIQPKIFKKLQRSFPKAWEELAKKYEIFCEVFKAHAILLIYLTRQHAPETLDLEGTKKLVNDKVVKTLNHPIDFNGFLLFASGTSTENLCYLIGTNIVNETFGAENEPSFDAETLAVVSDGKFHDYLFVNNESEFPRELGRQLLSYVSKY